MARRIVLKFAIYAGLKAFVVFESAATGKAWNGSAMVTYTQTASILGAQTGTFDAAGRCDLGALPAGIAEAWAAYVYLYAGSVPLTTDMNVDPIAQDGSDIVVGSDSKPLISSDAGAVPAVPDSPTAAKLLTGLIQVGSTGRYQGTTEFLANAPAGGGGSGSGAFALTINVTDSSNSANLVGARVRISGAQSGGPVLTNGSGNASVSLNAGAVTVSVTADGYAGLMPSAQTVTGGGNWTSSSSTTLALTLTPISITPASGPGQTTAYVTTYDGSGAAAGDITLTFRLTDPVANAGSFPRMNFTAVSDGDGLIQVSLQKNTKYQARRDRGDWIDFTTGADDTYALPTILGGYGG